MMTGKDLVQTILKGDTTWGALKTELKKSVITFPGFGSKKSLDDESIDAQIYFLDRAYGELRLYFNRLAGRVGHLEIPELQHYIKEVGGIFNEIYDLDSRPEIVEKEME